MKFKRNQIWLIFVFALIAVGLILISVLNGDDAGSRGKNRKDQLRKVEAFVVQPTLLVNDISINGSLQAFESVELKNEVAGRIVFLNLPEGKFVKKGTLLVKLFDDDLQAELRKLQSQLSIQEKIYKRQAELVKVNGITQNEYEQNGLQIQTLKADIDAQKALIRKTEVLAPFDGIIGLRNVSIGAIVNTSTLLATIRTSDKLKLDFFIPEKYSVAISKGMKLIFNLSGDEKEYHATVFASEKGIDNTTRTLKVRAEVDDKDSELIPGQYANVHLVLSQNPSALLIPTKAIIPKEDKKTVIVSRKGLAQLAEIKTGVRKDAYIEVTEGLQAGDTVVTTGILFIKKDSPLHFSGVKTGL
jgi:membrane fusion protein, multidrug efflux system